LVDKRRASAAVRHLVDKRTCQCVIWLTSGRASAAVRHLVDKRTCQCVIWLTSGRASASFLLNAESLNLTHKVCLSVCCYHVINQAYLFNLTISCYCYCY
jgi:hypothetical protein